LPTTMIAAPVKSDIVQRFAFVGGCGQHAGALVF